MTTPKAHHRSYTISIRALTPIASQQSNSTSNPTARRLSSHKPSQSTPNAAAAIMSLAAEPFPNLAAAAVGISEVDCLPRHNRELTLRRYLLLQEEHESVRKHLDELSSTTTTSPTTASPATSPTRGATGRRHHRRTESGTRRASIPQFDAPRPVFRSRSSGADKNIPIVLTTTADAITLTEMANEEAKLFGINEGIKRSLTELLNCETVRSDQAFRQWIMSRLMEVEKELRVGRRRRSCPID